MATNVPLNSATPIGEILPPDSAPNPPVLMNPLDGAQDISSSVDLSVIVSDSVDTNLSVSFFGRQVDAAAGEDFSIVVIPDSQYNASSFPSIFYTQMQWIVNNRTAENIVYVASLGDNVDLYSNGNQLAVVNNAYSILEAMGISYGLGLGNHDGAPANTSNFNSYFGPNRFEGKPQYGGHFGGDNDNHYDLFEAGGMKFLVVFLEYDEAMTSTSHPVLAWANELLRSNRDRGAIIITHYLLGGSISNAFSNQGQAIYDALKNNPNLFLILGGHLDVASRRIDTFEGNKVYSLCSDYQFVDGQQSGYLRIYRFSPTSNKIFVRTYSPTQNKIYDGSDAAENNFDLDYAMSPDFRWIGGLENVPSNSIASLSWSGLLANTSYEWYVNISNGTKATIGPTWSLTTKAP